MAETTKKMFLDKAGLSTFWGIIKDKFATKATAVGSFEEAVINSESITINALAVDGTTSLGSIVLNKASNSEAGLMSAADKANLDSLKETVDANTDFKGLELGDTAIAKTAKANLKLKFEKDSADNKEYIVLYDAAENGTAATKLDVSHLVVDGLLDDSEVIVKDGKTVIALKFNLADGTVKTEEIDVSTLVDIYTAGEGLSLVDNEFSVVAATDAKLGGIKTGYTATAEQPKTYAVQLDADGKAFVAVPWENDNTEYSVSDNNTFVKLGLDGTEFSIDESQLSSTIENLTNSKVDSAEGDDYVSASVEDTKVKVAATESTIASLGKADSAVQDVAAAADESLIEVSEKSADNKITINASQDLKDAVANANAAVQSVVAAEGESLIEVSGKVDNEITINASQDLKDAVANANAAVKTIVAGDGITATPKATEDKTEYTIALDEAAVASLGKADSAVQGVSIGDLNFNIDDNKIAHVEHDDFVAAFAMTEDDIKAICTFDAE